MDLSTSVTRIILFLDDLAKTHGLLKLPVCDNGPELTSKTIFVQAQRTGARSHFIQPGEIDTVRFRRELQR